jgi:phosphohistidine phosphatase
MGKELLLLRHAKSSWEDPTASDRERGLNNRGRRNAPQMGRALAGMLDPLPIHVSPARRAQLTLGGLQDGWPELQGLSHVTEEALYTFAADDLVAWLAHQDDNDGRLFIVGHNPAFTDLINWLCGAVVIDNLPTAGFARLSLDVDSWSTLRQGCGSLEDRLFPRELKE